MSRSTSESSHPLELNARPVMEPEIRRALLSRIVAGTRSGGPGQGRSRDPHAPS